MAETLVEKSETQKDQVGLSTYTLVRVGGIVKQNQ